MRALWCTWGRRCSSAFSSRMPSPPSLIRAITLTNSPPCSPQKRKKNEKTRFQTQPPPPISTENGRTATHPCRLVRIRESASCQCLSKARHVWHCIFRVCNRYRLCFFLKSAPKKAKPYHRGLKLSGLTQNVRFASLLSSLKVTTISARDAGRLSW